MRRIKHEVRIFLKALMFFTRIPCPRRLGYSEEYLNQASRYFPLIGSLVGLVAALVWGFMQMIFSNPLSILFSMVATIWMTGSFHEDGLADFCDGFGGGMTQADKLEIMKDSRIGTYGVIGVGFGLAIKFFALQAIPISILPVSLVAGHTISRFFSGAFIYSHEYVGEDSKSKAKPLSRQMSLTSLVLSGTWCLFPLFFFHDIKSILLLIVPIPLKWLLGIYLKKKIGGYTGDCLGAAQQIFEITVYLAIGCIFA